MDRIIESFLNQHIKEYSLESMKPDEAFEHFINRCLVNKYSKDRFDPSDIMTGKGEIGLDGIAILVNSQPVLELEELDDIVSNSSSLDVTFVFIQTKTSEHFSGDEIGGFIYGVEAFFAQQHERPRTNNKIENLILIKDKIYEQSLMLDDNKPKIELYFVTTGKWSEGNNLKQRIGHNLRNLKNSGDFSIVNFFPYDSDKVITTYKEMKKKIKRSFTMEKKAIFPSADGVKQAYVGFVNCLEFVDILKDNEGNILTNIFEDNVRDFQGYNKVNEEIKHTLQNPSEKSNFAFFNNGITIVAKKITPIGDKIEIFDYQIVNGCQTSFVLFDNSAHLNGSEFVLVKVVEVEDEKLSDRIIYTTNRQTEVKSEAFTSTKKFHKSLQDFYNSVENEFRLYYERRSKQYDLHENINKNKVITLSQQVNNYIATFLQEPHSTHRYYGELLSSNKKKIFLDNDAYEPYYISSYLNFFIENYIKKNIHKDVKKIRKFKYHLMCALKVFFVGATICYGKPKIQKKEYGLLYKNVKNEQIMINGLNTAILCLDKVFEYEIVKLNEAHRSREFTQALIEEILKITTAIENKNFLKIGDTVQCTVYSITETFVNVHIKTEDSRNIGYIHISKFANKYINNLRDEVEIGKIFEAKIFSLEDKHTWGMELTRL